MKKVILINTTGDRIRELRLRNHLTLDDVARHLGVGKQAIYKYEQGTVTNIPLENLEKMAELFGTTPEYLAGWSEKDILDFTDFIIDQAKHAPSTHESRIISAGIDRMPKERREQALKILQVAFSEYSDFFKEEHNDDT